MEDEEILQYKIPGDSPCEKTQNTQIVTKLKNSKGKLLFSSVELENFGVGRWLCSSSKMHHTLAQWRFENMFGFERAGFPKKYI